MLWAQAWMVDYPQEVLFWRIVWVEGIIQVAHAALLDEEGVVARGELGEPLPGLVPHILVLFQNCCNNLQYLT